MLLKATKKEGARICVEVQDDYMSVLTIIFNNAREDRRILKVSNDSGNNIFVDVLTQDVDNTKEWLSWFGNIKSVDRILIAIIDELDLPEVDYERYHDVIVVVD